MHTNDSRQLVAGNMLISSLLQGALALLIAHLLWTTNCSLMHTALQVMEKVKEETVNREGVCSHFFYYFCFLSVLLVSKHLQETRLELKSRPATFHARSKPRHRSL